MPRVDLETGFMEREEASEEQVEVVTATAQPPVSLEDSSAQRVREVVEMALEGTLPTDEPLSPWEVKKFSPRHISMVMDRCQGMTPAEIAIKYELNHAYVGILMRHPYTRLIQQALLSRLADRCADPIERMKAYANEMVDVKMEIVRDKTTPKMLRNQVASDILDRAGYGVRHKSDVSVSIPAQPSVPAGLMGRLVSALEAGQRVATVEYSRHTAVSARKEDSEAVQVTPEQEPGSSVPRLEASLEGSPAERRIA